MGSARPTEENVPMRPRRTQNSRTCAHEAWSVACTIICAALHTLHCSVYALTTQIGTMAKFTGGMGNLLQCIEDHGMRSMLRRPSRSPVPDFFFHHGDSSTMESSSTTRSNCPLSDQPIHKAWIWDSGWCRTFHRPVNGKRAYSRETHTRLRSGDLWTGTMPSSGIRIRYGHTV